MANQDTCSRQLVMDQIATTEVSRERADGSGGNLL